MQTELSYRSSSFVKRVMSALWIPLKFIFRIEIQGEENIPKQGAFMLIANHNSGALIESHSLLFLMRELNRTVFGLNHPALFKIPLVGTYFRKIGAITASKEAGLETLRAGHGLLIFPGGNRQALRPFSQRHKHSFPWAKGWADIAKMASIDKEVPIVPVKFIGSHNVNPILACNTFISKILVLPWLLGVKWFPVSLAQTLFSSLAFAAVYNSASSVIIAAIVSYFVFLATCLVPILPAKIKIKIYPTLAADDRLLENMAKIMDMPDYPTGKRSLYALNGIERFMSLHESKNIRYNSHFVFEFTGELTEEKFLATTDQWIKVLPQARAAVETGYWRSQRYVYDTAWFGAKDITEFSNQISDQQVDDFCHKPFALSFEPGVRFLVQSTATKKRVVFSCHHSLFDGAGQAFAIEEWSRIYNGEPHRQKYTSGETFRFRSVIKYFGFKKSLKFFLDNFQLSPPRLQLQLGHLVSHPQTTSRKVLARTIQVKNKKSIRDEFYTIATQAFDATLNEMGETKSPLLFYLPTGLRFVLKIKSSLQNAVVSHILFLKRDKIKTPELSKTIKAKISQNPAEANVKFIFGVLPLCTFGHEVSLRKTFEKLDQPATNPTCTGLLVNAAIPRAFTTPTDWRDLYISARGTLLKSPAVGLIFTGKPGAETITVQYVEGLVEQKNIELLIAHLQNALRELEPASPMGNEMASGIH